MLLLKMKWSIFPCCQKMPCLRNLMPVIMTQNTLLYISIHGVLKVSIIIVIITMD